MPMPLPPGPRLDGVLKVTFLLLALSLQLGTSPCTNSFIRSLHVCCVEKKHILHAKVILAKVNTGDCTEAFEADVKLKSKQTPEVTASVVFIFVCCFIVRTSLSRFVSFFMYRDDASLRFLRIDWQLRNQIDLRSSADAKTLVVQC